MPLGHLPAPRDVFWHTFSIFCKVLCFPLRSRCIHSTSVRVSAGTLPFLFSFVLLFCSSTSLLCSWFSPLQSMSWMNTDKMFPRKTYKCLWSASRGSDFYGSICCWSNCWLKSLGQANSTFWTSNASPPSKPDASWSLLVGRAVDGLLLWIRALYKTALQWVSTMILPKKFIWPPLYLEMPNLLYLGEVFCVCFSPSKYILISNKLI